MHLGIVAPLPPIQSGVAEWVKFALPLLEQHAEISCFVPDVEAVDIELRKHHRIRHVSERVDPAIDMLVYHVGNNPYHEFVFDALREGPAGLVEVHDGSLHHYVQERTLGRQELISYVEFGRSAHGWAGQRLADMRWRRHRGDVELFLYDYLQTVVDRARGVIVHSHYAEQLVQMRSPRVHTWVVPLHAPELSLDPTARQWTGFSEDTLLIAHAGFITVPKRADVYLEALRKILDRGVDAHLVFAGKPDAGMAEKLPVMIERLDLRDHVTITGYLETPDLERWIQAVDVIVNLRAPHVGESSGSLAYGLAAAKAVVVQPIGSWAEIPADVVVRLPVTDDDASALAATLFALAQDPSIGKRFGNAARAYASSELDAHVCVERLIKAAKEALERDWTPLAWVAPGRTMGALTFLQSGSKRIDAMLETPQLSGAAAREILSLVTPAGPHARLLAIDVEPVLMQVLSTVWGYQVLAMSTAGESQTISMEAQTGVSACEIVIEPFDPVMGGFDEFDVIIANDIVGDPDVFLRGCNRALCAQGLLVVLRPSIDNETLDRAGISPHVHADYPGWTVPCDAVPLHISVGTKASLPLSEVFA